jgi:hypothetical protein
MVMSMTTTAMIRPVKKKAVKEEEEKVPTTTTLMSFPHNSKRSSYKTQTYHWALI